MLYERTSVRRICAALARESRDIRQCRRLLALAAVAEGRSRAEAAEIGGMDRQTLRGA